MIPGIYCALPILPVFIPILPIIPVEVAQLWCIIYNVNLIQPMREEDIVSHSTIVLREAVYEDLPALCAMAGEAFRDAYTGKMPEEDLQAYIAHAFSQAKVRTEWENAGNTFIIAVYGQEMAGYAKINTNPRPERQEAATYIELERLYLLTEFQGRQIGTILMEHCIRYATGLGFTTLWLNVWEHNTAAIKFYQRWNFEFVDWTIMMRGNDPQKALWMRKWL